MNHPKPLPQTPPNRPDPLVERQLPEPTYIPPMPKVQPPKDIPTPK